jgi:hypothetical protein
LARSLDLSFPHPNQSYLNLVWILRTFDEFEGLGIEELRIQVG